MRMSLQENPFRPDGQLSKDADEILDAYKNGTLKQKEQHRDEGDGAGQESRPNKQSNGSSPAAPSSPQGPSGGEHPEPAPTTVLEVERSVILNPKTEQVEHCIVDKEKGAKGCCAII